MKKVVVIGASGLVGSHVFKELTNSNEFEAVGTYRQSKFDGGKYFDAENILDIKNFDIKSYNPDIVIDCAALTHVDFAEENEHLSFNQTVKTTENILSLLDNQRVKFIYVSTDYVFDGVSGPYNELAMPSPINIYGKHKLASERLVEQWGGSYIIARITNVYGDEARNKNFVSRLIENLKNQKQVETVLPIDQFASPIWALDVARMLHRLMKNESIGIYHLSSIDYMNRVQLAKKVISHFKNSEVKVKAVTTEELSPKAKRPLNGGLLSNKFQIENSDFVFNSITDYLKRYAV